MSTLTLKSWLFSKRTTNDEKAQPWGLILFLSNLILFFLGMMFIGAGIGIADHGTADEQQAAYAAYFVPAAHSGPARTAPLFQATPGLRHLLRRNLGLHPQHHSLIYLFHLSDEPSYLS